MISDSIFLHMYMCVILTITIATTRTGTPISQRNPIMMYIPPAALSQSVNGSLLKNWAPLKKKRRGGDEII